MHGLFTGFRLFSKDCRYHRITHAQVLGDCSYYTGEVEYCIHPENIYEVNQKICARKCKIGRCPYYSDEDKNEEFIHDEQLRLAYKGSTKEVDKFIEAIILNRISDPKIVINKEDIVVKDEFYRRSWRLIKL